MLHRPPHWPSGKASRLESGKVCCTDHLIGLVVRHPALRVARYAATDHLIGLVVKYPALRVADLGLIPALSSKTECDDLSGWIKKWSHAQKSHPKMVNPRNIAGERRSRRFLLWPQICFQVKSYQWLKHLYCQVCDRGARAVWLARVGVP